MSIASDQIPKKTPNLNLEIGAVTVDSMRVFAVMPAFREVSRVRAAVQGCLPFVERVLVVDDGSHDGTAEEAKQAGALVISHSINRGQGAALKTGTIAAIKLGADVIVHIDADGQHDPSFIPELVRPLQSGEAEIVFGSRFMGMKPYGMPVRRRLLLVAARIFNTFILGIPSTVSDPQTGLRAFPAATARELNFHQDGMAHCSEILRIATHRFRWKEVPIRVSYSRETLAKGQHRGGSWGVVWQLLVGAFRK